MSYGEARELEERPVAIATAGRLLPGTLSLPEGAEGVVLFAHGSGSGRFSPRNQFVARVLQQAGLATLLLDLLDEDEAQDREKVFDIELLAERLLDAADWLRRGPDTGALSLGYFGASTGAGAALVAAAREPALVRAVVSRGGRPDLASPYLPEVQAPTLLIVGGNDDTVLRLNEQSLRLLRCPKQLVVVPGATHLFSEPGALEEVSRLARDWFVRHLAAAEHWLFPPFRNREDAARRLAARLKSRALHDPLVLGIPRGGVVTGAVLARELGADLDVVLSRKLRAPFVPELAVGAVSEDGQVYLNHHAREVPNLTDEYLTEERRHQVAEIARRAQLFRSVRPKAKVAGRSVIVTDDGIATGSTMIATLKTLKTQAPREVIVAVPVAPPDRLEEIRHWCDDLVCLLSPETFQAVGQFYADFGQVEDEQVVALLRAFEPDSERAVPPGYTAPQKR